MLAFSRFASASLLAVLVCFGAAQAQLTLPAPSPEASVTQMIGLTSATVTYSRPSSRGRIIFGRLVPYGQLWRTGANRNTTVSFSQEVMMAGQKVPAGKYSLFTIPTEDQWTVILNKRSDLGGTDGYKQEEDLVRFQVKPSACEYTETFTFLFSDSKVGSANLDLRWDVVQLRLPIETDVKGQAQTAIATATGQSWQTYATAANYTLDNGGDVATALDYANKSIYLQEHFWNLYIKSRILAKMNNFGEAVALAEKSLAMAKAAKNDFYTQQNQANLTEWTPKAPKKKK
jgi:hypothetical protein